MVHGVVGVVCCAYTGARNGKKKACVCGVVAKHGGSLSTCVEIKVCIFPESVIFPIDVVAVVVCCGD